MKASNMGEMIQYAILMFLALLFASFLTEVYVPFKQFFTGSSVDFAAHLKQIALAKKVQIALLFTAALTYRRFRKKKEAVKNMQN